MIPSTSPLFNQIRTAPTTPVDVHSQQANKPSVQSDDQPSTSNNKENSNTTSTDIRTSTEKPTNNESETALQTISQNETATSNNRCCPIRGATTRSKSKKSSCCICWCDFRSFSVGMSQQKWVEVVKNWCLLKISNGCLHAYEYVQNNERIMLKILPSWFALYLLVFLIGTLLISHIRRVYWCVAQLLKSGEV